MKLIIAGSRSITDKQKVFEIIEENNQRWQQDNIFITEIVSGRARGIDNLGEEYARKNNISIKFFPADWNKHGKSAGYIRNAEMAKYADGLLAIWDGESKGTKHMIEIAKKYELSIIKEVIVINKGE